jgi:predicted glutamine amidotransferase
MCIAIFKPLGIDLPKKEILKRCFNNNPDGAGFMFVANDKVNVKKGFMSFKTFEKALKKLDKKYEVKNIPMVLHFRITTQGGVKASLTHPFALSNNYDTMKQLDGTYDVAIAHNGIISCSSSYGVSDHNDTMEFIKEIMFPLINGKKDYYQNENSMSVIKYLLGGNRFAIMDKFGHTELLGDWINDDNVYYSNSSYKDSPMKTTSSILDNFNYKLYKPTTKKVVSNTDKKKLSENQEYDILTQGRAFCERCGGELCWSYDENMQDEMICLDCCEEYLVEDTSILDYLV